MTFEEFNVRMRTANRRPDILASILNEIGVETNESSIRTAIEGDPEAMEIALSGWERDDYYRDVILNVRKFVDRRELTEIKARQYANKHYERTAEPTKPTSKQEPRKTRGKSKKGCTDPWRGNVVRYVSDIVPAVQDILWRRGALRMDEITDSIIIEAPHPSKWYRGETLGLSAVIATIHCAIAGGFFIKVSGGTVNGKSVERIKSAEVERQGWYWRGSIVSVRQLADRASVHRSNLGARLETGWDVEAARSQKGGKGADKKRKPSV